MSRRDNAQVRCPRCRVHQSLCFCAQIPRIPTRTRLLLLAHCKEWRKPTNTGFLAVECLPNSEVHVRGNRNQPADHLAFESAMVPVFLFPAEDARPIEDFRAEARPILLIVPDGNWRQAAKMRHRVSGLDQVPTVSIPSRRATEYRLRHENRAGGLATMEAIASAFGILEGPAVETALDAVFHVMVERSLWSRGQLQDAQVRGGIPQGALRHDPLSGSRR